LQQLQLQQSTQQLLLQQLSQMPQQQQLLMQQLFQLPQQQLLFQQLSQLQPQQQMLFLLQLQQQQQLQSQLAGLPLDEEKLKQSLFDPNVLQTLAQSLAYSYQASSMFPFLTQQFGMGLGLNLGNDALNAAALYSAAAQANNFFLNKKTPIMMDTSNSSSLLHHTASMSSSLKCPEPNCNKVFTRAYNLKSHQLSHSGVRPYQCR